MRDHEVQCPFCAVDLPSSRISATLGAVAVSAFVLFGVVACSGDSVSAETANTTTTNGTTEDTTTIDDSSDSAMTDVETDTDDGPDETTLTTGSFYAGPEIDFIATECDPIIQDCPEGEKCVAYASTGGNWDANKCVPITGSGQPGEPCTYGGVVESTDDCDGSGWCWNAEQVDGALVGTCTPFCSPPTDDPQCPDDTTCVIANDGSITLCIPTCDPLAQDCPEGQGCYLLEGELVCLLDYSDPMAESCDFIADCPSGSQCVAAEMVPECEGAYCCAEYCSLTEPMCEQPGTECVPLFDGESPPGYEDVGLCLIPE